MKSAVVKKIIIVLVVCGLVVVFFLLGLDSYLTLEYLRQSRENLMKLYGDHPAAVVLLYAAGYVLVTALSLPGAAIMTLAGGAVFGVVAGTVIVSFASSLGATAACLVARYLLRDWVQGKFGNSLIAFNSGIERDGAWYLFTLRLIPLFPFFMINLLMGLTKFSLVKFYWVSQLGMLAGTILYVNAGHQLASVTSLSGILSPGVIISLALLGIFPLAAKKGYDYYKSHNKKDVS